MDLYLIRHAQSRNNAQPAALRVEDPPLTDLGHVQARHLAARVAELQLTRLVTSPFRRALQTAEHIYQATGLVPEVCIDLHETGGCVQGIDPATMVGRPGMSRAEILAEFPRCQIDTSIDGDGWWRNQPYECESLARQRAARLLAQTRSTYAATEHRVAFVMHGDFELLFLSQFHPLPLVLALNASLTHVRVSPEATALVEFNSIDHMADHMMTW
ncbi:MAG: histidine phosphatase family protein [Pirellulaceae bacterium]